MNYLILNTSRKNFTDLWVFPNLVLLGSGEGFNLGRSSEILRDEIKFTKFVGRMRKRFSGVFNDM